MPTILANNIARVGLVFDLLAFFMVAPDLLGEKRLKKVQHGLTQVLWWLSVILFVVAALGGIVYAFACILIPLALFLPIVISGITLPLGFPLLALLLGFLAWLALKLMELVERLTKDKKFRRLFLKTGVVIFLLGGLAQFLGTFSV